MWYSRYLRKRGHRITHIAAHMEGPLLATGEGTDVRIWSWNAKEEGEGYSSILGSSTI